MTAADVSAAVNEHLVEENRRLREALRDAREVADLLRKQASHHNDLAQEIRTLRRALETVQWQIPPGTYEVSGEDVQIDKFGNMKIKKVSKSSF